MADSKDDAKGATTAGVRSTPAHKDDQEEVSVSRLSSAVSGLSLQNRSVHDRSANSSSELARKIRSSPNLGPQGDNGQGLTPLSSASSSDSLHSAGGHIQPHQPQQPKPSSTATFLGGYTGDIHARVLTFQQSRQKSCSNSGSNGASNFTPGSIQQLNSSNINSLPTPGSPVVGSPQPTSPSSPGSNNGSSLGCSQGPSSGLSITSPAMLSRSSSSSSSQSSYSNTWSAAALNNEAVTGSGNSSSPAASTNMSPQVEIPSPSLEGLSKPIASFSGALVGSLPNVNLHAKKPSISQRRGMKLRGVAFTSSPASIAGTPNGPQTTESALPQSGLMNLNLPSARGSCSTGGVSVNPRRDISNNAQTEQRHRNNLFSNYRKYLDIKTGSLKFAGKASLHSQGIDFSSGSSFRISLDQLESLGELGRGNYGTVTKVLHKPTNVIMAMKEIRLELDESKFTQIIMELEVLHKCVSPYIVDFYGAFFVEGAVYVCMEYMDGGSLDKIYDGGVDEQYLAVITDSVIRGLKQLKEEHNIIHRDVKPTNILISTSGKVKLCDFGVSGNLVASIAKTNIGCQSYMAPERIRSRNPNEAVTYTVESDIWSLGLSILEISQGQYPYPPETYQNIFSQLSAIVDGDPPSLPADRFSPEAIDFVNQCLSKVPRQRPSYEKLLSHPWLQRYVGKDIDIGQFVVDALAKKERSTNAATSPRPRPPLHNGRLEPISFMHVQ